MDIFKRPAMIVIVVVSVIVAIVWSYFSKVSEENKTKKIAEQTEQEAKLSLLSLANIDPSEFDELVKTQYASGRKKAEEINPNYKLSAIQIILPSLEINVGDTRYIFSSPTDSQNNFTITFSNTSNNYLRAIIPKDDYLGDLAIMDTSLWKFNYVTAIQIAEKAGGKEWREKNGLSSVEILLFQDTSLNILKWTVQYDNGSQDFSININASNGKIVQ